MRLKTKVQWKRFLAAWLCFILAWTSISFPAKAASDEPLAVVYAASDFQKIDGPEASSATMMSIITAIKKDYASVDGALFCGDYSNDYTKEASEDGMSYVYNNLKKTWGLGYDDIIFVQGNHDPAETSNLDPTGANDPKSGKYGVFVLNEDNYNTQTQTASVVKALADQLETYLNNKISKKFDKPIFITSHLPLHYSMRTYRDGDNQYGKYIFDVLNEAAEAGLNIIYLHGHNHSQSFENYHGGGAVFYQKGDTMLIGNPADKTKHTEETIQFTYMNAGYQGRFDDTDTADPTNTASIFEIYEDEVVIRRYDANGLHNLKSKGVSSESYNATEITLYSPNETIVTSPQTIKLNRYNVLNKGDLNSGYMSMGESAEVSLEIRDGNTYETTWSSSNESVATVKGNGTTATVTAVNMGKATITVEMTSVTRASEKMSFDVVVARDGENLPSDKVYLWTQGEAVYKRQPLDTEEWDTGYFDKAASGPFVMTSEVVAGGQGEGYRYAIQQGTAVDNNELIAKEIYAYSLYDGTDDLYIKAAHVEDTILWNFANKTLKKYNYYQLVNKSSKRYIYVIGEAETRKYGQEKYMIRSKSIANEDPGLLWRMTSNRGLQAEKDSKTYRLYYSDTLNHFAVTTKTIDEINQRMYLYYKTEAPYDVTAYVDDTSATVYADAPLTAETGDSIILEANGETTEVPITISMLEGTYDLSEPGAYGGLSVVYCDQVIATNYTLVVKATNEVVLMENDGTTAADSSIFKLATSMTAGKKYMIVTENDAGIARALGNMSGENVASHHVLIEEFKVNGEPGLYIDASSYDGTNHKNDQSLVWEAQTTFTNAANEDKSYPAADGWYFLMNVQTKRGLAWDTGALDTAQGNSEPNQFRWGSDYSTNGLRSNVTDSETTKNLYLNYRSRHNLFLLSSANERARIYLYEQVTDIETVTAYVDDKSGVVEAGSGGNVLTGDQIVIKVKKSDGTISYEKIDVYVNMLDVTEEQLKNAGVYSGLTLTYNGTVICTDYELKVTEAFFNDYPEFPDEGAVKIDKQINTNKYNYLETGAARIDLSATGIPLAKGSDVIFVLDTSSSMNDCIHDTSSGSRDTCANKMDSNNDGKCDSRREVLQGSMTKLLNLLKQDINGHAADIDVAVVDFNGYTQIDGYYRLKSGETLSSDSNTDASMILLDFEDINEIDIPTVVNSIPTRGGTNYDRGMERAYDMLLEKQQENALNGETRNSYVVFMSDGAPWQYNYILGNSGDVEWNKYLTGELEESDASFSAEAKDVWRKYYNTEGKHWTAEAIKGSTNQKYKIIDRDAVNFAEDGVIDVNGLDAKIISIGLGIFDDTDVTAETCNQVLQTMSSGKGYFYDVKEAEDLDNAFTAFAGMVSQADNAVFTDQMGAQFDLQMKTKYESGNGEEITLDPKPSIEVKRYELYKRSEIGSTLTFEVDGETTTVEVTEALVGKRKPVEPKLIETITFNADGTEAYSDKVDVNGDKVYDNKDNILINNVICAANFWYNTDTGKAQKITLGNGKEINLESETFYWNIGIIPEDELVLSYDVYLTGSMEGTRPAGTYDTNTHAELAYTNYLDHECELSVPTPKLPWNQATVGYAFYLVNSEGKPIINQTTGETGSFEQSVKLTQPVYQDFMLNSEAQDYIAKRIVAEEELPEGYVLYDEEAEYKVELKSNGEGYYIIYTDSKGQQTTYVVGVAESAVTGGSDTGEQVNTTGYTTANTVVWFAVKATVKCMPDTVVIDYGLPVDINVTGNDLMMGSKAELAALGTQLPEIDEEAGTNFTSALHNAFADAEAKANVSLEKDETSMKYGSAELLFGEDGKANGKVCYSIDSMQMDEEEKFYYAMNYKGDQGTQGYYYSSVTVIPATMIYYEDSFITYHDGVDGVNNDTVTGAWKQVSDTDETGTDLTDGTTAIDPDITQSEDRPGFGNLSNIDANNIYGYDPAYKNFSKYSLGSAAKVSVSADNNPSKGGTWPTAEFTFRGTGFDVISISSGDSGTITVEVYNTENTKVKSVVVDTYYGYEYLTEEEAKDKYPDEEWPDGKWEVTDTPDTLYQIPVMKIKDLDYGTYRAVITSRYSAGFDHREAGSYHFWLDAIRIYDPAGTDIAEGDVVGDAYLDDNEAYPDYEEVRNLLLDAGDFNEDLDSSNQAKGVVFIDGYVEADGGINNDEEALIQEVTKYENEGPNNEVYLKNGQAIAFNLTATEIPDAIHLSMKLAKGSNVIAAVAAADNKQTNVKVLPIATATDIYYDISSAVIWATEEVDGKEVYVKNDQEMYYTKYPVIIYNGSSADSDSILSVTNLKWTFETEGQLGEHPIVEPVVNKEEVPEMYGNLRSMLGVASEEPTPEEPTPEEPTPEEPTPEEPTPEEPTPEEPEDDTLSSIVSGIWKGLSGLVKTIKNLFKGWFS